MLEFTNHSPRTSARRLVRIEGSTAVRRAWLAICCCLIISSGCAWPGFRRGFANWPIRGSSCVLENPTQTELVNYLNESISKIPRWQCNDVTIKSRGALGMPISLRAIIAVEQRRNFRLVAQGPGGGTEVDLGSNDERFWFYARQSDRPGIYTCRHELLGEAQQEFPLPLNPDWFAEVLGVVPFENSEVTMKPHERNANWAYLIRDREETEGTAPLQIVTLVDCCQGLIVEQRLQEANGSVIAFARMREFKKHPGCQSRIPYVVDLEWPKAKIGLTLQMRRIDIKESQFAGQMFEMPQIASVPVHEYSGNMARRQRQERSEELDNAGEIEFVESEEAPPKRRENYSRTRGRQLPQGEDRRNPFEE